ncbi:MAG: hypothetical protein HOP23_02770 [Methylococcaceae bacterium]|nr:hypothetical protein [Methylococcaceae bacterium]
MLRFSTVLMMTVLWGVSGCVSLPNGPSVMVLPGTGMSFDQFQNDDFNCQQFASRQVGGTTPNQAGVNSGVATAAIGTAVGAAAGAAIDGGHGAAVGAGTGLVAGSLIGAGAASNTMYGVQQHYDVAYIQCMYAKGHQVPVSGQFSGETSRGNELSPSFQIPPPPPGSPPPAPPR